MQGSFFPSKEAGVLSEVFSQILSGERDKTYLLKEGRIGVAIINCDGGGRKLRIISSGSLDVAYLAHSVNIFASQVLNAFPQPVENERERIFLKGVIVQILKGERVGVLPFGDSGSLNVTVDKHPYLPQLNFAVKSGEDGEGAKVADPSPARILLSALNAIECLHQCFGMIKKTDYSFPKIEIDSN